MVDNERKGGKGWEKSTSREETQGGFKKKKKHGIEGEKKERRAGMQRPIPIRIGYCMVHVLCTIALGPLNVDRVSRPTIEGFGGAMSISRGRLPSAYPLGPIVSRRPCDPGGADMKYRCLLGCDGWRASASGPEDMDNCRTVISNPCKDSNCFGKPAECVTFVLFCC